MRNNLERYRAERGWTQQQLGDQVEVSRQTIISLESGRRNPTLPLAFRLARVFGVAIEALFVYEDGQENE